MSNQLGIRHFGFMGFHKVSLFFTHIKTKSKTVREGVRIPTARAKEQNILCGKLEGAEDFDEPAYTIQS